MRDILMGENLVVKFHGTLFLSLDFKMVKKKMGIRTVYRKARYRKRVDF